MGEYQNLGKDLALGISGNLGITVRGDMVEYQQYCSLCKIQIVTIDSLHICKNETSNRLSIYLAKGSGPIYIKNPSRKPSIVIIFPVTRSGSDFKVRFESVYKTVSHSSVAALVVIDKTVDAIAKDYFMEFANGLNTNLYVLRRNPKEAIFDSQQYIKLDELLWIGQLHDDDSWSGVIRLPKIVDERDMFLTDFLLNKQGRISKPKESKMPSARIVFCWVPSQVWNRFSEFITSQGGHIAGSADYILDAIAFKACKVRYTDEFRYEYSNYNWSNRRRSARHLLKMSLEDGWGPYASVDIAIINRTLDLLASLSFFDDLLPSGKRFEELQLLIASFRPSVQRRFIIQLKLIFAIVEKKEIRRQRISLYKFLQTSWKITEISEVIAMINYLIDTNLFPMLTKRFIFWKAQISEIEHKEQG